MDVMQQVNMDPRIWKSKEMVIHFLFLYTKEISEILKSQESKSDEI